MNINPNKNNVNFGWTCETHRLIMETAIKDMPQFAKYKKELEHFVQQPDHDDIGFLANKHFYFGEKYQPKQDIFIKDTEKNKSENLNEDKKKSGFSINTMGLTDIMKKITIPMDKSVSFMDFDGKNNAKAAYIDHIKKIDKAIDEEDEYKAIENAARACHFLQDVTQPQHIENTTVAGKAMDLKIHTDYEKLAEHTAPECAEKFKPIYRNPRDCAQLFDDSFTSTKEMGKITRKNEHYWKEITENQFNTAVQATKEFLLNLSNCMGLETQENIEYGNALQEAQCEQTNVPFGADIDSSEITETEKQAPLKENLTE